MKLGTILLGDCCAEEEPSILAARAIGRAGPGSSGGQVGWIEGEMPVLQDWSWQMRKRASADRRDAKETRLSRVGGSNAHTDKPVPLEVGVQAHIGNLLRAMYDSALKEPIPERFLELLRQMDAKPHADDAPALLREQP